MPYIHMLYVHHVAIIFQLSERVLKCVFNNTLTIEPVHERNPFPRLVGLKSNFIQGSDKYIRK